jgi:hypothetical protein
MDEDREFYQTGGAGLDRDSNITIGHNGDSDIFPPGASIARRNGPLYRPEFIAMAERLSRIGLTDLELAEFFGTCPATLYNWKSKHPEFAAAIKLGKVEADDRVEESLYRRAVGYSIRVEKLFAHQGVVTRAETVEHIPASDRAAMHWLNNRRPEAWRNSQELTGKNGAPLIPDTPASKMELARWAAFLFKQGAVASEEMDEEEEA